MDDRLKKGKKLLNTLNPEAYDKICNRFKDVCPELAEFIAEFPYGSIYQREGLNLKTRELITIASLVTLGNAPGQLKSHIISALNAGCSQQEIVEVVLQMSIYAGFPASINGMDIVCKTFEDVQKEES